MTTAIKQQPQELSPDRAAELTQHLQQSPYAAVRELAVKVHEEAVTLRGAVPTYYLRQVALALMMKWCAPEEVLSSEIDVTRKGWKS